MGVLDMLVKNVVENIYKTLPADIVEETKKQVLDTLGVIIAGSTCNMSNEITGLVNLAKSWGGKEESTILGFGGRVPAPSAAFVNGVMCVRRDFDDTHHTNLLAMHPSRSIIPTALAMAEYKGHLSGKEFITSVALGHDLECRIAAGGHTTWYVPTGFFGAAATAGKILGFNEGKLKSALSLAFHQICGANSGGGSAGLGSLKGMSNGFACRAGVISAQLTESGFTADWDFLEPKNRSNFFEWFSHGSYMPALQILNLGEVFMGSKTMQKEFPCCHAQHMTLGAILNLIRENGIKSDDVEAVTLHLPPFEYSVVGTPTETKLDPPNVVQTQFSLFWGVASAIVYGDVDIKNFSEEAFNDIRIREMARKVSTKMEMELAVGEKLGPAIAEVRCKDGKVYSKRRDVLGACPENPWTFADVTKKFRRCCEYSIKPISSGNQDKVIQMIKELEKVDDSSDIISSLIG